MGRAGLQLDGTLQQFANEEGPTDATVVLVGWDGRVMAALFFRETVRAEAGSTLAGLQALGVRVGILTGDRAVPSPTLRHLPASLPVKAGLLPEDKVRILRTARTSERPVAMVGDGINDAPALAAADVGIAVGTGADLTREAADVNVLSPDLGKVLWIIQYARTVRRTIRANLFWAFAYNGVAIAIAAAGRLNPLVAAAAMIASSLFTLWNTRRLAHA
jgi:P-type E1-E2 ATPase